MYRIGTNITNELFVYPTREILQVFFAEYTPCFKNIFGDDPAYHLYFHGSVRDRMFGYNPSFENKRSFDVDLIIFVPEGPFDFPKIHEALDTAVRIGFKHRLLIDICCMTKPDYFDVTEDPIEFTKKRMTDDGTMMNILKLSPTVNAIPGSTCTGDTTVRDAPYIVYESLMMMTRKRCIVYNKYKDKIQKGFLIHKPTPVDHFPTASMAARAITPTMKNMTT